MQVEIRVVLTLVSLFIAGDVWWCEDCGRGGFGPYRPLGDAIRHRPGCMARMIALGR